MAEETTKSYLSLMPYFNLSFGKQSEYVYLGEYGSTTDENMLSKLDYNDSPSLQLGAKLRWEGDFIYAVLDMQDGIPAKCGNLYDYDWLNKSPDSGYPNDPTDNTLTNFSRSDSSLYRLFSADLSIGAKIPVKDFKLCPYIGLFVKYSKYIGTDGEKYYGQKGADGYYSSYNSDTAVTGTFSGNVLALERKMLVTWIGFAADWAPLPRLSFSADAAISPYSLVYSYDTHYLTTTEYLDIMHNVFSTFKGSIGSTFKINELNSLEISWNITGTSTLRGKTYYTESLTSSTFYYNSSTYAGASYLYNSIYIGYKINI